MLNLMHTTIYVYVIICYYMTHILYLLDYFKLQEPFRTKFITNLYK